MDEKIFVLNPIEQKPFQMSAVEIIIPFYDEHAKVLNLMNDIFSSVTTNKYLITLVDDGSKNRNFVQQLKSKKIPGVRFLSHTTNKGFGASINTALKNPFNAKIPYVAIMHSDVRVHDMNWLFNLGSTLNTMKVKGTKMVSPLTDNPLVSEQFLQGKHHDRQNDKVLTEGFLPMYCVLAHRQLFNKVGLFLECPYAGTEVEEYAWRMKKNGFNQGVCGTSWVQHEGRGTLKKFDKNKKAQDIMKKIHDDFMLSIKKM